MSDAGALPSSGGCAPRFSGDTAIDVDASAARWGAEVSGGGGQTSRRANGASSCASAPAETGRAAGSEVNARPTIATSSAGRSARSESSGTAGWVAM